jgi:type VI secretion system protein ImpF
MRAPETWHKQSYLPSLLDRLLDDAPQQRSERPDAYAPNAEGMHRIVERDLGLLLNTTNLHRVIDAARYPEVAASVVNYGIPAVSGSYPTDRNWEQVEDLVRVAITRFEPRLIPESLRIRPLGSHAPLRYNKLMFEIQGFMQWSPYPLEFRIQSQFDLETNTVSLDSGSHRQD